MRLTQLKLSGFKSFVDPTSIHVPGQLVGIVGPNGCGKSNVIDAVRWVLGETRASALRGDSMMDVIFNGSVNRKPLARASVELIFDNTLGRATGQWSQYAEISVKRVLQRDGESAYYINNTHVRRRDITDIFLGTGLGPRAYAIVEQGMISRVIEAKPEELRVFLEEAAGISKYKERRRETENRLSDTRDNLSRVTDIRTELGTQIEKLEKQAEVASRYQEFQSDLQLKQQLLWYLRRRDAAAERERHAQEIVRTTNELEGETARLRETESHIESARSAHYTAGDGLNAAQAALYGANTEVARHESELRHVEETRQRLENRHIELRAQLGSWREQRSQLTQALHMWANRQGGAKQKVEDTQRALAAEAEKLPHAEQAFRVAQDRLNEVRSQSMQAESRFQLEQTNLSHSERSVLSLEQRDERLKAEMETLDQPDTQALHDHETRVAELERGIEEAQAETAALQESCSALERERQAAVGRLNEALREHSAAEAQLATLRQIQESVAEDGKLVEWLERHGLSGLPRFWEKLRIEPGWETAVEAVLRERLHAHQMDSGEMLSAFATDKPPAKASFYAAALGAERGPQGGHAPLSAKITATDQALAGAIEDWLSGMYAFDGTPTGEVCAALPAGASLVNREGHRYSRHTVSYHAPDATDSGLLVRQAEIEALTVRCGTLGTALEAARKEVAEREQDLAAKQGALAAARDAAAELQGSIHEARIELLKLTQAAERYRERSSQIQAELEGIALELQKARARKAELLQALQGIQAEIESLRTGLSEVREADTAAEVALSEQRRALQQAERNAQEAIYAERECVSKITEIDNSVNIVDQQIERADLDVVKLTEELAIDPIPSVREALDAAIESRIGCEKTLAEARNTVEAASSALRALEEERLQIEARMNPLRERVGELRLKEQAASINHDQFAAQLAEAAADEAVLAAGAETAPRPSALQAEITRLNQSIAELGAVNLAALEELKTSSERKGFLDSQSADLEEAVKTLEDAIHRIDRETRELLRETFDSVNRHFGSLFPLLFGGGEAKLIMTGEEILDAGVQVMAHPPGKRNSSIHLLSGGEKALTAISLVFSLFQLNPAPFCLLDEVDAPLDDSNTQRFCDLVKKMSSQTQFLYISHNKITMEMASQLVGVTMQESGVSRVVAVDIDEALRMREELAA
ncbi:MAG: chromosome segregation protein SMC [Proteobacteria bacterium]|nr:chromosome segregation protein SMC [Pseudomonadota bacterium]